ncbi:MAG: sporulation protein [Flaviaesturariibacter sp.]|nr:sporulation protein [Flaviaesturariibacter sp.]
MKKLALIAMVVFASCNAADEGKNVPVDSPSPEKPSVTQTPVVPKDTAVQQPAKTYANERFKEVTVEKTAPGQYRVTGKAQVFEAAFSWVIEDGHNELKEGHEMTDEGAPAWGAFRFTVNTAKPRTNSTLHLILFEYSAKDGSRQYELPIALPE